MKNKRGESIRSRKMIHVQNIDRNNNPYTTRIPIQLYGWFYCYSRQKKIWRRNWGLRHLNMMCLDKIDFIRVGVTWTILMYVSIWCHVHASCEKMCMIYSIYPFFKLWQIILLLFWKNDKSYYVFVFSKKKKCFCMFSSMERK